MNPRRLLVVLLSMALVVAVSGCGMFGHKKKPDPAKEEAKLPDQNSDAAFQSFLSRLRKAAAERDMAVLPGMMTPDFGYSWPSGEGSGVFDYWDRNNLWREVNLVLNEKFVPSGAFMVAPGSQISSPNYNGYLAGLRLVNGAWRFAYFVSAHDIREAAASSQTNSETTQ